ncbi:hypothetical protein [Alkalihalobacillus sp. LMS39]|nr:hypothetical protein [Alkalihalobacillus sp. LMS39]UOE92098.1 hypothetical protein MM271_12560 [Alkalihalobacillus sp. LMS39]
MTDKQEQEVQKEEKVVMDPWDAIMFGRPMKPKSEPVAEQQDAKDEDKK